MAVEENPKATSEEEHPNPKYDVVGEGEGVNEEEDEEAEAEEVEEGEIVGGESSAALPRKQEVHRLEHKWTFWFDNPSAKSKQAAWDSSMRSICTFSFVEELSIGKQWKEFLDYNDSIGFIFHPRTIVYSTESPLYFKYRSPDLNHGN